MDISRVSTNIIKNELSGVRLPVSLQKTVKEELGDTFQKTVRSKIIPLAQDTLELSEKSAKKAQASTITLDLADKLRLASRKAPENLSVEDAIRNYNGAKLEHVKKHSIEGGDAIYQNWQKEYGIADINGKFTNAVIRLKKEGGAIDKYLDEAFPNMDLTTRKNAKKILSEYLQSDLEIYSYDRMRTILKSFSGEIEKIEKPVFYIPQSNKSYDIVASLYKEINPEASFIRNSANLKEFLSKNKGSSVVVLDDCLASGNSAITLFDNIKNLEGLKDVHLFTFAAAKEGIENVSKKAPNLKLHFDGEPKLPLREGDFYKSLLIDVNGKGNPVQQTFFLSLLQGGTSARNQYNKDGLAIMFEHMAPNNNNIFAANMMLDLFTGPKVAIKNSNKVLGNQQFTLEYPPKWLEELQNKAQNAKKILFNF